MIPVLRISYSIVWDRELYRTQHKSKQNSFNQMLSENRVGSNEYKRTIILVQGAGQGFAEVKFRVPNFVSMMKGGQTFKTLGIALIKVRRWWKSNKPCRDGKLSETWIQEVVWKGRSDRWAWKASVVRCWEVENHAK